MLSSKTIRKIERKVRAQDPEASERVVALIVKFDIQQQTRRRAAAGYFAEARRIHDAYHARIGDPNHTCGGECLY